MTNLQQVHLRINDAATSQPTPVRLRITDAEGRYYAPYGRLTDFATGVNQDVGGNVQFGAKKWSYIDGACEILLPPGKLRVEITKGPEYKPIDEEVTLLAGKMSMRFTIERWCDMRKNGWHSGDMRVHFMSPDAALLEGQAEDVAVVNLLACVTEITQPVGQFHMKAISSLLAFSGQSFARQSQNCGVAVNTHNEHEQFGSLGLLHCHRVVYPLTSDSGDWTLEDWCGQCHRKKGLVVWTRPFNCSNPDNVYGAALVSVIGGNIDALEWIWNEGSDIDEGKLADYYRLLDAGFCLPLVGASAKSQNIGVLGAMRTYAYVPSGCEFTYSQWIEAVRAGRTFVSSGPMLQLIIDAEVPGSRLDVSSGKASLEISVSAQCGIPFGRLELLWNGEIIAASTPTESHPYRVEIYNELPVHSSGWLAARCVTDVAGGSPLLPLPWAHTSAIGVHVDGQNSPAKPGAAAKLLTELDALAQWARQKPDSERLLREIEVARTALAKKMS